MQEPCLLDEGSGSAGSAGGVGDVGMGGLGNAGDVGMGGLGGADVGRMVGCSKADDRKMIRLVRARRLLYARNNMPVASYYTRVKVLWGEVARHMGWTVAEVRKKWSHIRNSYSRHLRNEIQRARTGKGRMVSRWYLADELEFLREHMATDISHLPPFNYASSLVDVEISNGAGAGQELLRPRPGLDVCADARLLAGRPLVGPGATSSPYEPKREPKWEPSFDDESCSQDFDPEENSSYFQFFRGIHNDYQDLPAKKQRQFKRRCLELLHELLDEDEGPASLVCHNYGMGMSRFTTARMSSEDEEQRIKVEPADSPRGHDSA